MLFLTVLTRSTRDFLIASYAVKSYEQLHNPYVEWVKKQDRIEPEQTAYGIFPFRYLVQSHRTCPFVITLLADTGFPSVFTQFFLCLKTWGCFYVFVFLLLLGCCEEYFVFIFGFVMIRTSLRPGPMWLHTYVVPTFWRLRLEESRPAWIKRPSQETTLSSGMERWISS